MNVAPRTAAFLVALLPWISACGGGGGGGGSGGGGGGGGGGETIDPERSEFHVLPAFGTPADGTTEVELAVRLVNTRGEPLAGARLAFAISGLANALASAPPTDADGRTRATLTSFAGQKKSVRATAHLGPRATELGERRVEFLEIPEGTYFVRTSGSDGADGRSPRTAWRTLGHALQNLPAGGTLHIGAGAYPGDQRFTLEAPTATPSVLRGDRDGHWTGDAGEVRLEGGAAALSLVGARNVLVTGLTFAGAERGLVLADVAAVLVRDCRASENTRGLSAESCSELAIESCRISANQLDGVELTDIESARFQNNLVYGNGASGIVFHSAVADMLVRFNTFHANGGDHLREEAPGSSGAIEDNIFSAGGSGVLDLPNSSVLTADRNLVWDNEEAGADPIVADPFFEDPDGIDGILGGIGADDDDFRLRAGSGALDASLLEARAVRLAGREYLAAKSSRADGLADGSLGDLPAANMGFHDEVPERPHVALPDGAERLYIADDLGPAPRALALGLEEIGGSGAPALGHAARWTLARRSPLARPEELVAVVLDTGSEGTLCVRRHDGRGWSDPAVSPFQVGLAREALLDRGFDLEHEARSGRAMLVWANAEGEPRFQTQARGRWSGVREVPPLPGIARRVRWVELVPRAESDELALLLLDDERRLTVALWDGANFAVPRLVASGVLHRPGWRPFDGAFESVSGDLVVAWGFDVFAESLRWTELVRATGTWREGLYSAAEAVSADVELESDPASDRIAAILGEADLNDDVAVCVWNGNEWIDGAELTLAGGSSNRLREVLWLGTSGVALVAYPATTGAFRCALYLEHGWRVQPTVALPGVGRAAALELRAQADGSATGVVLEADGDLHGLRFEANAFRLLDGEAPLAAGLDPAARVFALAR